LAKILDCCPRLEIIDLPVFDAESTTLLDYAQQSPIRRPLIRLGCVSLKTKNVWTMLSQRLPRLRYLSMNLDAAVYKRPHMALVSCQNLVWLKFDGPLFAYLILDTIINSSPGLETLTIGQFNGIGRPEIIFFSIGHHPSLRQVIFESGEQHFLQDKFEAVLNSLIQGRIALFQDGFEVRPLQVKYKTNFDISSEMIQKLTNLRVTLLSE